MANFTATKERAYFNSAPKRYEESISDATFSEYDIDQESMDMQILSQYMDNYMDERHNLVMEEYHPSPLQIALAGFLMANSDHLDVDDALMIGSDQFRAIMRVYL